MWKPTFKTINCSRIQLPSIVIIYDPISVVDNEGRRVGHLIEHKDPFK